MKRLSKAQEAAKAALIEALGKAVTDVNAAVEKVNSEIEATLNPAIEAYNSILADVETFRDEIVGEMETYYDERSDKWREGDAGSNYESWKGDWEGLDISELDAVEVIEEPGMSHGDELEALPTEVEQ
jgi:hypothetical protein